MQVYTSFFVFTGNDNPVYLLVVRKRKTGFFFGKELVPGGSEIKNGGGKYAFPGGRKDHQDKGKGLVSAALREWREETGVDMDAHAGKFFQPQKVKNYGVITANLADGDIEIAKKTGKEALEALRDEINVNLRQAAEAADAIERRTITTWAGVTSAKPRCPECNELEVAEIWDTTNNAAQIKAWKEDKHTDWFYNFFETNFPDHAKKL